MDDEEKLVLTVEPSNWGLPSTNPYSVAAEAYLSLADLPLRRQQSPYPFSSVTGPLPSLRWGNTCVGAQEILPYLSQHFCNVDAALAPEQQADAKVWVRWAETTLYPATLFLEFCVQDAYYEVTRCTLGASLSLPVALLYRQHRTREARALLAQSKGYADLQQAQATFSSALEQLAARLANRPSLFPSAAWPCSADVMIAAQLALLYHHPASVNPFRELLIPHRALLLHFQYTLRYCLGEGYVASYEATTLAQRKREERRNPPPHMPEWPPFTAEAEDKAASGEGEGDRKGAASSGHTTTKDKALTKAQEDARYNNMFILASIGAMALFAIVRQKLTSAD
eukprot:g39672.t1